jgi:hypothetical protein
MLPTRGLGLDDNNLGSVPVFGLGINPLVVDIFLALSDTFTLGERAGIGLETSDQMAVAETVAAAADAALVDSLTVEELGSVIAAALVAVDASTFAGDLVARWGSGTGVIADDCVDVGSLTDDELAVLVSALCSLLGGASAAAALVGGLSASAATSTASASISGVGGTSGAVGAVGGAAGSTRRSGASGAASPVGGASGTVEQVGDGKES